MASLDDLRSVIQSHPVIDNHAHNILSQKVANDYDRYPLESLTSEAQGEALVDHVTKTLAHQRAVNQLAELYDCEPDWKAIKATRQEHIDEDFNGLVKRCLEGTHMLLIDDGLVKGNDVEHYSWHDSFTKSKSKRLLRIEALAANLAEDIIRTMSNTVRTRLKYLQNSAIVDMTHWKLFEARFLEAIQRALDDPHIAGYKSIICYRTGLKDIREQSEEKTAKQLNNLLVEILDGNGSRFNRKPLNDFLVQATLCRIQNSSIDSGVSKPIQFHTGLGDADIDLMLSNPAHLQSLIEEYNEVNFVLLHSSYPFTQEAGYLATMFKNVYLDIGEVFPMVSRDGQLNIVRQSMEIAPTSKILWSTDGHFHPETFYLANRQFRETLEEVRNYFPSHLTGKA